MLNLFTKILIRATYYY